VCSGLHCTNQAATAYSHRMHRTHRSLGVYGPPTDCTEAHRCFLLRSPPTDDTDAHRYFLLRYPPTDATDAHRILGHPVCAIVGGCGIPAILTPLPGGAVVPTAPTTARDFRAFRAFCGITRPLTICAHPQSVGEYLAPEVFCNLWEDCNVGARLLCWCSRDCCTPL
jgi:hypothetical protein